jgi:hypothetical protein
VQRHVIALIIGSPAVATTIYFAIGAGHRTVGRVDINSNAESIVGMNRAIMADNRISN